MQQLEFKFEMMSETLKEIEKEIPDFKKHGFETREEWNKAKSFDRAFKHMEQMQGGNKKA
tara:strand:+ start:2356 stop:2535 length:180 start_codon:yes stop_codon:yes gene_type:complete